MKRNNSLVQNDETTPSTPLHPWARLQLKRIDPSGSASILRPGVTCQVPIKTWADRCKTPPTPKTPTVQQLAKDIERVERQIYHDLDHLTLILKSPRPPPASPPAPASSTSLPLPDSTTAVPLLVSLNTNPIIRSNHINSYEL